MAGTIYALSSGVGRAGVAVIRVSGPEARASLQRMGVSRIAARKATLADIRHPGSGELIDRGLVLWFPGPHSFTGEDVAEIHVHGGRAVVAATLEALSSIEGVRAAEPGEFTRRAFAAGKLDLGSVEGLADLIAADTELQRRQAIKQITGSGSRIGRIWRQSLVDAQALVEAHLDFPDEEEIPVDVTEQVSALLTDLLRSMMQQLSNRKHAELVRNGAVVLLAGPPNSGKSTLLNRIAEREVSIISEVPGTTRDLIEITLDVRGLPVTFIDSAGIRETGDPIESQGIARTRARSAEADLVLWLSAANERVEEPGLDHPALKVIRTKIDLAQPPEDEVGVSAQSGAGISELLSLVYDWVTPSLGMGEPTELSSRRQYDCVASALTSTEAAYERIRSGELELAAEELRSAAATLQELIGVVDREDILDEVFQRFCLGK